MSDIKLLVISLGILLISIGCNCVPVVEVEEGKLSGTYYSVSNGRIVNAFLGVPYAAPPVGNNRFRDPQPLQHWFGTWNASQYGSPCLQYTHYGYKVIGDEDCLFLNIYTPQLPKNGINPNLDVIIYIHGGCMMFGTGNVKRPDYLLNSNDIVFISLNYRLGPLGFFSTGDEVVPGNNGLKDQVAALKWVQRNIRKFGGNPDCVTITGMSAGGASVHYHFVSPLSEGLFHRGIAQSGSLLMPWTLPKNVPQKSRKIAKLIGCSTQTSMVMVDCLRNRPAVQIVQRLKDLMGWKYNPYSPIGPVVESGISHNSFLPAKPIDMLRDGRIKNIPLLISTTEDEGLYPAAEFIAQDELLDELNNKWSDLAPYVLDFNFTVPKEKHEKVSNIIRRRYFGDKKISRQTSKALSDMIGDRLFNAYIIHAGKMQASVNTAPVFYYRFNYRGKYSLTNSLAQTSDDYGVSHGDDTQYILGVFYANGNETENDRAMIDVMVPIWISFAKTGIPRVANVDWKPISTNMKDFHYLQIRSPSHIETASTTNASDLFEFWSTVLNDFTTVVAHDEL